MSLELALQQNTAAVNALVELLTKGVPMVATPLPTAEGSEAPAREIKPRTTVIKKPAEKPAEEPVVEATAPAAEEPAVEAPTAPVTVDDCKALILAIASKKGRAAAADLLGKFGAAKLSEVASSRFAELKAAAEKVLAS